MLQLLNPPGESPWDRKVELVYEGEQEGPGIVANNLIGKAIRTLFLDYFPNPDELRKHKDKPNPYKKVVDWFGDSNMVDIINDSSDVEYNKSLSQIQKDNDEKNQPGKQENFGRKNSIKRKIRV